MRIEWLNKKNREGVIIFYNGWGMDASVIAHLVTEHDLLMVYDYRSLNAEILPDMTTYKNVYLVAWSMGVWAASNTLSHIHPLRSIAINGTEKPIDNQYGIPIKTYMLTEKGMNELGRKKFYERMFTDIVDQKRFELNLPHREVLDVCEELCKIRQQSIGVSNYIKWDNIYISKNDKIFPTKNQLKWWKDKAIIKEIDSGHYPFYYFKNWNEILNS